MDVFGGAVGERLQQPSDLHGKPAFAEQQSLPADAPRHAGEKAALFWGTARNDKPGCGDAAYLSGRQGKGIRCLFTENSDCLLPDGSR